MAQNRHRALRPLFLSARGWNIRRTASRRQLLLGSSPPLARRPPTAFLPLQIRRKPGISGWATGRHRSGAGPRRSQKVREYETAALHLGSASERYWPKRALHLAGGQTEGEKIAIRYYLDQGASILAQAPLGGETISYYKNSSDIIQQSPTEEITNLINEGVSVIPRSSGIPAPTPLITASTSPNLWTMPAGIPFCLRWVATPGRFSIITNPSASRMFSSPEKERRPSWVRLQWAISTPWARRSKRLSSMNRLRGPETTLGLALKCF